MSDMVKIVVDGSEYNVTRGQDELRTTDGRRAILQWVETFPAKYIGHRFIGEPSTPKVIWTGTLATGGRAAQEFQARIVMGPKGPAVLREKGLGLDEISIHEIRSEYWLRAIVALASTAR